MRLFLFSTVLTVILLFIFAELITPAVTRTVTVHHLPVHKILYLERDISDKEMSMALKATMEWNEVTNGEVTFDIKRLPQDNIDLTNAIIIIHVTPDFPDILLLDRVDKNTTLGYCSSDTGITYIALVTDRFNNDEYTPILLHELGHALGLEHLKTIDGIGTLMYPSFDEGSNHITKTDLEQFCRLYNCDVTKFHESKNHGFPEFP